MAFQIRRVCQLSSSPPNQIVLCTSNRANREKVPGAFSAPFVQTLGPLVLALACLPIAGQARAQAPITPSGLNTQVSAPLAVGTQTQYNITGGTRPGGSTNLFHSFGNFNVPANNIANFFNETALPTTNILGRVTEGNVSNIFGTIQTTGFGGANLFLMNPAGFLFGPNATLNVGGTVAFTSANYLKLADGGRFNANPNATSADILTAAPVAAFGFLGSNPGAITVQGSRLSVADGTGISLVGGNIAIQSGTLDNGTVQPARLSAPGGQINLASVASPGELSAVDFTPLSGMTMGNISLPQGASLETSADTAGPISIRGGQFLMDDASIKAISMNGLGGGIDAPTSSPKISITAETIALSNGALITADSYGTAAAGDITLNVDTFTTQAGVNRLPLNPTNNFNFAGNFIASDSRSTEAGAGPAGNIIIQGVGGPGTAATSVLLKDSTISSRVFGGTPETAPSSITITADAVVLTNEGLSAGGRAATIVANTLGTAPAGYVAFNVNTLRSNVNPDETSIAGAKKVFVISNNDPGITAGPTGTITISGIRPESTDAARLVALSDTNISTGVDGGNPRTAPGNITITTDTLSLKNDTQIFTASFGEGGAPAGNIFFNVNTLRANTMPDGTLITGVPRVLIASVSLASGQAGNITISGIQPHTTDAAKQLALNNIEVTTAVFGSTPQTAPASLTVTADNIHLTHSKFMTDTQGPAPAGNIVLTANTMLADDASQISSSSSGAGPGGNISMTAGQSVTLSSGSSISASSTGPGNAGNIAINAGQQLEMNSSSVKTEAAQATGGNIDIQAVDRIRLVNSTISTSVLGGAGSGGNITIDPNVVILQNSQIIAQAVQGAGGNISIVTPLFLADAGSLVDASSQFGLSGTVNIQSPTSNLAGTVASLPSSLRQVQSLETGRCVALAHSQSSSLTVAGRDTLPAEPGGWSLSPFALIMEQTEPLGLAGEEASPLALSSPPVAAMTASADAPVSLRRLTPAGFLTQSFAKNGLTECRA